MSCETLFGSGECTPYVLIHRKLYCRLFTILKNQIDVVLPRCNIFTIQDKSFKATPHEDEAVEKFTKK